MTRYHGIGFATLCVVIVCYGCAAKSSKSESSERAADPVSEFEKLVAEVEARRQKPLRLLVSRFDGTMWSRTEETFSPVKYDVRKTDSLVTPIVGRMELTNTRKNWGRSSHSSFDSKADAMASTEFVVDKARSIKCEAAWRNGKWEYLSEQYYPFSDRIVPWAKQW